MPYTNQSNCITLIVVPTEVNPSKSKSLEIVNKLAIKGTRTITIAIKLDLIVQEKLYAMEKLLYANQTWNNNYYNNTNYWCSKS